ncbi:hypothetical protein ACH5RR_022957 [Cinchona calisaya]|uniref:Uncharacterized protein n=1 Tax=Cinchona calisaya TaxID=153742 RepID=A0ABD2ZCK9_9GENT
MNAAAEAFVQESGIDANELLGVEDSPEGFLEDWWRIYWSEIRRWIRKSNSGESSSMAAEAATGNELQNFPVTVQMQQNPFIDSLQISRTEMIQEIMRGNMPISMPDVSVNLPPTVPNISPIVQMQQIKHWMPGPMPDASGNELNPLIAPLPMLTQDASANFPAQLLSQSSGNFSQQPLATSNWIQQQLNFEEIQRQQLLANAAAATMPMQLNPFASWTRSGMNLQITSGMPMSMPGPSANFPVSQGLFGDAQYYGQTPTTFANMYGQEYLNSATNVNLLDVEQESLVPYSSNFSQQPPETSERTQQQLNSEEIQRQQLARVLL